MTIKQKRTEQPAREVRMLTPSEKQSLRDENLKAHLLIKELIAEAKRTGTYLK